MSELDDAIERARQLHAQGQSTRDIAELLRTHPAQVERWLASTTHSEAAEAHARAWSANGA